MASIGDVAAALRAVIAMAEQAAASLRAADDRLGSTLTSLQVGLDGSSNHDAHDGLATLRAAREGLAEALDSLKAGNDRMGEYIASIAGGGVSSPTPGALRGATTRTSIQPHNPKARDPERVAAIRRFGWPRNSQGRTSARGLVYDESGKPILHQPLKPLGGDKVYNTPDLKEAWRGRDMATSWHIEGGVAAYMRATQTKVMTLWLNIPACGGYRRPDPKGCHENLSKILPPGYTLHVRVEGEDGSYQLNTYPGTGEALKTSE